MRRSSALQAVRQAENLLKEWLDGEARFERDVKAGEREVDLVAQVGRMTLVAEIKMTSDTASIARAIEQVRQVAARHAKGSVPIVVVPYMGEVGQRLCEEKGASWFDLSGNAHIAAPGLRIHVEGRPNKFKRPGRPSTAFAPRSSRIARQLLINSNRSFHQRELSRLTGLDEGFTSRVVRKLEADQLIVRDDSGAVRPRDPALLLDAWREVHDFGKHHIVRGHVSARSAEEVQRSLCRAFEQKRLRCAVTGLGAAWLLTKFAGFRLSTIYVAEEPPASVLRGAGFREEERGANVWLVVPNDEGVFMGAADQQELPCVHPVQAYVDLEAHPERAAEAAEELRKQRLTWKR